MILTESLCEWKIAHEKEYHQWGVVLEYRSSPAADSALINFVSEDWVGCVQVWNSGMCDISIFNESLAFEMAKRYDDVDEAELNRIMGNFAVRIISKAKSSLRHR